MSIWLALIILTAALFPPPLQGQAATLKGYGGREVDSQTYELTLELLRHRIETRRPVESLLLLSANSDPDVLGLIATDTSQPLPIRELAANAILDQLFIADPYFQACGRVYLERLGDSPERSLRLKSAAGAAIFEHWCFLSGGRSGGTHPAPLALTYAAQKEEDPDTKEAIEAMAALGRAELLSTAALQVNPTLGGPYRPFDSIPEPLVEEENPGQLILKARKLQYRAIELNTKLELGQRAEMLVWKELDKASRLQVHAFLTRFRAMMPLRPRQEISDPEFLKFFENATIWSGDPYFRSLSLAVVAAGPRDRAVSFVLERMVYDKSAFFRVAAADLLRGFCVDSEIRQRLMSSFRDETDAGVKLRMLHSLIWPFGDRPPPDIQAFLLARLRDQEDIELQHYIVAMLGIARVRSAIEPLTELARSTQDQMLRDRIGEALRTIRGGR